MVCRAGSPTESNADIARDLRLMVRERLVAGDSDAQVIDHVVARYGEFVLFRRPSRRPMRLCGPRGRPCWCSGAVRRASSAGVRASRLRRRCRRRSGRGSTNCWASERRCSLRRTSGWHGRRDLARSCQPFHHRYRLPPMWARIHGGDACRSDQPRPRPHDPAQGAEVRGALCRREGEGGQGAAGRYGRLLDLSRTG